mgnify:CR=1 FL=1
MHRIKSAQLIEQDSRKKADFNLDIYAKKQGHFGSGEMIELHANIHTHLADLLLETPLAQP